MDFVPGPPDFAVEVRSKNDYDAAAESARAAKRADYFEAGTKVVWDVDPVGDAIDLYDCRSPDQAVRFSSGQYAHAVPWLPGWTIAVDDLFSE
jgi:Uma2 family endonuclease